MSIQQRKLAANLSNLLINDLKNLSMQLKSLNTKAYNSNNNLANDLLILNDQQILLFLTKLMSHLLLVSQLKNMINSVLSILSKIIMSLNVLFEEGNYLNLKKNSNEKDKMQYIQSLERIVSTIIDILSSIRVQNQFENSLRVIQTAFSLINKKIIIFMEYNLIIRLYAICFACCTASSMIQNIAISALFALTEVIFTMERTHQSLMVLQCFLEYLLNNKKYSWMSDAGLKGLVWDLTIMSIRNLDYESIKRIFANANIIKLLNNIYQLSSQQIIEKINDKSIFDSSSLNSSSIDVKQLNQSKQVSINFRKGDIPDFIRFYKAFVYFTIHLWIKPIQLHLQPIVNFIDYIQVLNVVLNMDRNNKMYLLIEGICLILVNKYNLCIEQEKGIILIQILMKISEQLSLANNQIVVNWDMTDLYLDKMCGEYNQINQGDFIRIIKMTIFSIRSKFQQELSNQEKGKQSTSMKHIKSSKSVEPNQSNNLESIKKHRWQRFLKSILKTIRYLTEIKYKHTQSHQQEPQRKIMLQLQQWFLISPSNKLKNLVLQELYIRSKLLDSKLHIIKVSQCVQIGFNLLYGYFDKIDTVGLTIIMKMIANITIQQSQGNKFQQLEEVVRMAKQLFHRNISKVIKNKEIFIKTIEGIIQCINYLIADLSQSQNKVKMFKIIQFVVDKLFTVLIEYYEYISENWTFITAFLISLSMHRDQKIQQLSIKFIQKLIFSLLKKTKQDSGNQTEISLKQQQILSLYIELAKCPIKVHNEILLQLKQLFLFIKNQQSIMQCFQIINILSVSNQTKQIHEVQQSLIKQCLFLVTSIGNLRSLIEDFKVKTTNKNLSYNAITLLWLVADQIKKLYQQYKDQQIQYKNLWKIFFKHLQKLAKQSPFHQFKQSTIHAFTQILAENIGILGSQFTYQLINNEYLELFYTLLDLPSTKIDNIQRAQMAKYGIKNFNKIIRKVAIQKVINEENCVIIDNVFVKLNESIDQFSQNVKTSQYLYEICVMIDSLLEQPLGLKFFKKENAKKLMQKIGNNIEKVIQKDIHFKRKLTPFYKELLNKFQPKQQ